MLLDVPGAARDGKVGAGPLWNAGGRGGEGGFAGGSLEGDEAGAGRLGGGGTASVGAGRLGGEGAGGVGVVPPRFGITGGFPKFVGFAG